ncbi:hypothetical protein GF351_02635 [Candidatus Woesearchaeota archaeon]|nr:hypothetical protein [Candidatus Woesearchaeota archaeon]
MAAEPTPIRDYGPDPQENYSQGLYLRSRRDSSGKAYFNAGNFLAPEREYSEFVKDSSEIMEHVKEVFRLTTGRELPEAFISIHVLGMQELEKAHEACGGSFHPSIRGFAVNRMPRPSDIFVLEDDLDSLLLTIGHEIGHCISPTLKNKKDEEAKAFAFAEAWMKTIKEHDIAGIGKSIRLKHRPAKNNIHDKASDFVQEVIAGGKEAMQAFREIASCELSIDRNVLAHYCD